MISARVAAILAFSMASCFQADAQTCQKGTHVVRIANDSAELQNYTCSLGANAEDLRITYFNVSEVVAGALLMGPPLSGLDQIVGRVEFIDNEVYRRAKGLFAAFGASKTNETTSINWTISNSARDPDATQPSLQTDDREPMQTWYLSRQFGSIKSDGVLLKSPTQVILNTDHWPPGYKMAYRCTGAPILCTTIWKYIAPADFDPILGDMREAYQRAEKELKRLQARDKENSGRLDDIRSGFSDVERSFKLFRHLSQQRMPNNFLFMSSTALSGECESDNWSFNYSSRPLMLLLAVIENRGSAPLQIDNFLGASSTDESFRPADDKKLSDAPPSPLKLSPKVLQPGAKIAITLRLVFVQEEIEGLNIENSMEAFNEIQSGRRSSFSMTLGGFNSKQTVTKTKKSFLAPTVPEVTDYAYGPEISISGITVNGRRLALGGANSNLVHTDDSRWLGPLELGINKIVVRRASEQACCPILYSRQDETGPWVRHGKVLHVANAQTMTDRVELPSLRTHFRIAEEEAEAAFIENVSLSLTLRSGRTLQLPPRQPPAGVITADRALDVDFDLPSGVEADQVTASAVEIVGYYRRYSEMLLQALARPSSSRH